MRMITLAKRTFKEILRDPINLAFGLGFPLVLLILLSAIQANVPVSLFEIQYLVPGIAIFGLSFITLFSATIISKDRGGSLLQRLYSTPVTALDFILAYTLPVIPIAVGQSVVCYVAAMFMGLNYSINIVYAVLLVVPISILYIAMGLLFGSMLTDKQVGGVCGGLLTNISAWLSGTWFDLTLVGGSFKKIAYALPFVHAVEVERAVLAGNYHEMLPHLAWVAGYTVVVMILAVVMFLRQMKKQ